MAIQAIQGERFGNSNWQIGQIFAFASTSMAQDGHSLVFTGRLELFRLKSDLLYK